MLKNLVLSLKEKNRIPYLDILCSEMKEHQVNVLYGRQEVQKLVTPEESLIICDSVEVSEIAQNRGIGYLVYATKENQEAAFSECLCVIEGFDEIDYEFINHMYERSRGIPWTILTTDRCVLREITVEDVDRLYEIYADPSITAYMEGLYENPEEERQFTRDYMKYMYGFYGFGLWIVVEKNTGRMIGRAGITNREGYENLELGYLIETSYQHQGYAEEVCRAIISYAQEHLGCEKLNAFIQKENAASIALARKLGFVWKEEVIIEQKFMQRFEFVYKNFTN